MDSKYTLSNVQTLCKRAHQYLANDPLALSSSADRKTMLALLNDSLAAETICVLRYMRHHFMARDSHSEKLADEFLAFSNEEQSNADLLAERIVQMGGEPNYFPDGLVSRCHAEYREGATLVDAIKEDLIAERIAIDGNREIIQYLADNDPETRRILESVLAVKEGHVDALVELLLSIPDRRMEKPRHPANGRNAEVTR